MLKQTQAKVLARVGAQPYVSPSELAQWPDVNANTIHYHLDGLESEGYVGCETLGWIRDSQKRYFPRARGLRALRQECYQEFTFRAYGGKVERIRNFGPGLEALYYVGPRVWHPANVEIQPDRSLTANAGTNLVGHGVPLFVPDVVEPVQFYWMPDGPVHAVMEYREPLCDLNFFMPLVWFGTHAPSCQLPADREELLLEFAKKYDFDGCPVPPGVCIAAADILALYRAVREISPDLPLMVFTLGYGPSGKFGFTAIRPMFNPLRPNTLSFSRYTDDEDVFRSLRQ